MAIAIYSSKPGENGRTEITHVFYGDSEDEAWGKLEAHAADCPKYGPAYEAVETIESVVEIAEIPRFDDESLAALPNAGVPCVGARGVLSIERRLRIPRPTAGRDGSEHFETRRDARATVARGCSPIPGR